MAAAWFVGLWAVWGVACLLNVFLKLLMGNWIMATCYLIMASSMAFLVYRFLNNPIIKFRIDSIEILNGPMFSVRHISNSDISCLENKSNSKYRIILVNHKSIALPIKWLKKVERKLVISEIEKRVTKTVSKNVG